MSEETRDQIGYYPLIVGEETYCVWDWDLQELNLCFLNSLDPEYFDYSANVHEVQLESEGKQFAALALRNAYAHGLESLFALLCASLQAPHCVVGWFVKYRNKDLFEMVHNIEKRQPILSRLSASRVTWKDMADNLLPDRITGDGDKDEKVRHAFARLWSRFAEDFLDESRAYEHNSIKHGLRVRLGGMTLRMGIELIPGVAAPPQNMRTIAQSEFGTSFYVPDTLGDPRNLRVTEQTLNWHPAKCVHALHLIAVSMRNVISCLKVVNGADASQCSFLFPSDESAFEAPWQYRAGISSWSMNSTIHPSMIKPLSREEIINLYNASKEA